jgi:hypothetical protein
VTRQCLWLGFRDLRKLAFDGFGYPGVQRASRLAQQCAISRVLYQGMFEQITRLWRHALWEQQTGCNETIERRAQLRLGLAGHRR